MKAVTTTVRRSQTEMFQNYRSSFNESKDNIRPSFASFGDGIAEQSLRINSKFSILSDKIEEIKDVFIRRSKPTFDNQALDACNSDIVFLSKDITARISALRAEIKKAVQIHDSQDAELLFNLQQSQCLRLRGLVQRFRAIEAAHHSDHRSESISDDPISKIYEDFQPQLTPDQMALLSRSHEELQERNTELENLVSMMNELNDMFRDVSMLILEQGTALDRVDTKIEVALEEVSKGNDELFEANEDHSSKGFIVYIAVVTILIILCLFILYMKWKK